MEKASKKKKCEICGNKDLPGCPIVQPLNCVHYFHNACFIGHVVRKYNGDLPLDEEKKIGCVVCYGESSLGKEFYKNLVDEEGLDMIDKDKGTKVKLEC